MGRVTFWPLYLIALYSWIVRSDIPHSLFVILCMAMGYVFGSKGINSLKAVVALWKNGASPDRGEGEG
jgi:hypothetical protein